MDCKRQLPQYPLMVTRQQQTRQNDPGPGEIPNDLGLARRLHELVSDHPDFEVLSEPTPSSYYFRYLPNGFVERREEPEVQDMLNNLNREIVDILRRSGFTSVMTTIARTRVAIQISILPAGTPADDIDVTFEAIARWGRLLTKTQLVSAGQPTEMEALPCLSEFCSSPMEV